MAMQVQIETGTQGLFGLLWTATAIPPSYAPRANMFSAKRTQFLVAPEGRVTLPWRTSAPCASVLSVPQW
jgi:hypothetical protein